jgi:hypothetical protein
MRDHHTFRLPSGTRRVNDIGKILRADAGCRVLIAFALERLGVETNKDAARFLRKPLTKSTVSENKPEAGIVDHERQSL